MTDTQPMTPAPESKKLSTAAKGGIGCLSLIGVVVFLAVGLSLLFGSSPRSTPSTDLGLAKVMAQNSCEKDVKAKLKSPATADFTNVTVSGSQSGMKVSGNVDAQNSFGGTIRNTFTCTVVIEDDYPSVKSVYVG